mmetsp:Transcript_40127/g.103876  ORF Transcript_40127/g.103876 Transcript_40127/m.103876 type:complete len:708 (-) Transcript_40127:720-2843(-)
MLQVAKDEHVLLAGLLGDLDVGAVQGANDEAAIHHKLHVGGARGLGAGRGDVLAQLRGRDDDLRQRDVVVRDEDKLEQVADVGVVVDLVADRADQLDDALGHLVARGRLAADDAHAGLDLLALFGSHLLDLRVSVDDAQHIHELALVLVDALHLDVKQRVGADGDAGEGLDLGRQPGLVLLLHVPPLVLEVLVVRILGQLFDEGEVGDPLLRLQLVGDKGAEAGVAERQPAALRDAVGLVLELLRPEVVKVGEGLLLDDLRVNGGDAVDGVRRHERQEGHADKLLAVRLLLDDRHLANGLVVVPVLGAQHLDEPPVDVVDDLHVARQDLLHQGDRPLLQSLRQDGVVGEGEHLGGQLPGLGPPQAVLINEQPHQLRHADGRVGVVQLEGHQLTKVVPAVVRLLVAAHHILDGGRGEEVLLLQSQLLALVRAVIGVQHAGQRLGALLGQDSLDVVTGVEGLQVKLARRLGGPEAQIDGVVGGKAGDGVVIRDGRDGFAGVPLEDLAAVLVAHADVAVVLDVVGDLRALDLPRVAEVEPVVRLLVLEAVLDGLPEHAVLVADTVAPGGQVESGHGVQKARCQAAQTAIAKRGVALLLHDGLQVVAHLMHGLRELVLHLQVVQRVVHGAPHQELHGHVVHALWVLLLEVLLCVVPRLDQSVAQAVSARLVGLKVIKLVAGARQSVFHMIDDALLDAEDVVADVGVHERVQ